MATTKGYAPTHDIDAWDFPLHSEILPGLWMGGTDDEDTLDFATDLHKSREITKDKFDSVVTLYAWARPADWLVTEFRYGYYDSDIEHIDFNLLYSAVDFAYASWKSGQRVLIRCQAGINRSGLVTALVLIKDGYSPEQAIDLLRAQRSRYVLINRDFEKFILSLGV